MGRSSDVSEILMNTSVSFREGAALECLGVKERVCPSVLREGGKKLRLMLPWGGEQSVAGGLLIL